MIKTTYKIHLKKQLLFYSIFPFTNMMDWINRNEGIVSSAGRIAIQSFCSPQCKYSNMVSNVFFSLIFSCGSELSFSFVFEL